MNRGVKLTLTIGSDNNVHTIYLMFLHLSVILFQNIIFRQNESYLQVHVRLYVHNYIEGRSECVSSQTACSSVEFTQKLHIHVQRH